jgi:phosphomannomutase
MFAEIARLGGRPLMWKTGRSLIHDKMMESRAPLGGEFSGHIFFADGYYGYDDALYCAIRLINIVSGADKTLSSYAAHMPVWVGTPEIRIEVDDTQKFAMVDELREQLRAAFDGQGYKLSTIDGLRIDGPGGWMVLRASNTQNCIVARIEAQNAQILDILKKRLEDALSLAHLSLPETPSH